MTQPTSMDYPILRNVFHPSDFSPDSEMAFAHALTAALMAGGTDHSARCSGTGNGMDGVSRRPGNARTMGPPSEKQFEGRCFQTGDRCEEGQNSPPRSC